MEKVNRLYFFTALFLGLVGGVAKAGPIKGYVDCLNDEDCLGANKVCFRNTTMRVGKCICKDGYKPAKEDPIKCLNKAERECHTNLDCDHLNPCISHFPILHAMNRVMDDQFFVGMKKECFDAFDPTVGGFRRSDEIFQQPYYFDPNRHLHTKYAKFHPTYIKFVEDAMLVLFLLCVLITLLVVHRGSCYRQIRQARRNGPLRYIIPHPDDLPPPYSNYGPAIAGTNDGQTRRNGDQGNGNIATDDVDGHNMVVDLDDKNRTETPPPSYDEALAITMQTSENTPQPTDGTTTNDNLFVALPPNSPPPLLSPIEGATSIMTTTTNSCGSAPQVTSVSSSNYQPSSIRTNV